MGLNKYVRKLRRFRSLFTVLNYARLRLALTLRPGGFVRFRIRPVPTDLWMRTTSQLDYIVLKYVFLDKFHLPFTSLPGSPVILDLGANIGFTCVDYANQFPDARIFGYEMDKANFDLALLNTSAYPSIKIENMAVGAADGRGYYDAAVSVAADAYQLRAEESATSKLVNVTSLAGIISRHALARVDFIKMDIEGAEVDVFSAADLSWLEVVDKLHVELHDENVVATIAERLRIQGFNVERDKHHFRALIAVRRNLS